jgi:hypothetical protein
MYTDRWQRCASAVHAAADGRDEREKQLPFLGNDRLPRQARDKQKGKLKNRASSCRQDFDVSGPSAEHEHIVQLHQAPIPGTNGGSWCEKRSFQSHLYTNAIILPRQARDKHRKSSFERPSCAGRYSTWAPTSRQRFAPHAVRFPPPPFQCVWFVPSLSWQSFHAHVIIMLIRVW